MLKLVLVLEYSTAETVQFELDQSVSRNYFDGIKFFVKKIIFLVLVLEKTSLQFNCRTISKK